VHKQKQEQQCVAVISIRQVASDAATLQCCTCSPALAAAARFDFVTNLYEKFDNRVRTIPNKAPNTQYPVILAYPNANTNTNAWWTRKLCYRKDDRAMRPTYGCPENFRDLYAHGHYSQHFHGLLFRSTLWMFLQNLKSVALPVPEIIRGTRKKLDSPWIRPRSLFSKIFNGLLFG